jgi:hypothetical protein
VPSTRTLMPGGGPEQPATDPQAFLDAVAGLRAGLGQATRPELTIESDPPPKRLAPHAAAFSLTVIDRGGPGGSSQGRTNEEIEIGWGKLVLLYDPASQPGWSGPFRIISYVRAELDQEIAADPLINAVGWSWLTEALDHLEAEYGQISGTVTRVVTESFGAKQHEPAATEFELRASWSPTGKGSPDAGLAAHAMAWCDLMCAAAGLPPRAAGVATLRQPRRGRQP